MSTTHETPVDPTPPARRFSRRARWGVPAVAVIAVAGAIGVPLVSADASPSLPTRTAGQLLADLSATQPRPFSGTVVETARLGVPAIPGQESATSPVALLSGSHTVRVWYGGAQQVRVALVGDLAESDLVRNGRDVWLWSSKEQTAKHITLAAEAAKADPATTARAEAMKSLTPAQAAAQALAAIDPTTTVSVDGTARVAGRAAYELVLRPKDTRTLVTSVRLAIDAKTHVPLRVQVFGSNQGDPAFETGFTTVTFTKPPASTFKFTAPPGTKVTEQSGSQMPSDAHAVAPSTGQKGLLDNGTHGPGSANGMEPTVIGTGWTSIVKLTGVDLPAAGAATSSGGAASAGASMGPLLQLLKPVSGAYGSGRVLKTSLVSVLLLDDGTAYVGAVPPAMLEQAASTAAAARTK